VHVNTHTHTHTHTRFCNYRSRIRKETSSENSTKLRPQLGSILVSYFWSPAFVSYSARRAVIWTYLSCLVRLARDMQQ